MHAIQDPRSDWVEIINGVQKAMDESGFQLPGGSHATSNDAILHIAQLINLQEEDVVWDIGVGTPKMAFCFSLLTEYPVIGTDIGNSTKYCFSLIFHDRSPSRFRGN
jgi:hypothetical protein